MTVEVQGPACFRRSREPSPDTSGHSRIGAEDFRAMDIKECLASCNTVNGLRQEALSQIHRRISAQGSLFYLWKDGKNIDFKSVVAKGLSDESVHAHNDYYHKIDPFVAASPAIREPMVTEQIVPWKELLRTRYYSEFMRRFSLYQHMLIPLLSKRGPLGTVVLLSSPDETFSNEERRKAHALRPLLELALEKALALERITQQEYLIHFLVDEQKQKGIMVLDGSLVPIYENERARASIKRCYDKNYDGLKLPKTFEDYLEKKISSEDRGRFTLQTDPSSNVRISVSPIPYSEGEHCYLLLFEFIRPFMEVLRGIGLSKRESEVVSLLCEGFKNGEIAAKLFISEATVENHLSRIYEKTGVNNRTCLAHRIHVLTEGHS